MSGVVKFAVKIVAAAAVAAVGFAIGGPIGAAIALAGISYALATTTNALFGPPKPSGGGGQTKWKADPYAGIPYVIGRTLTSGNIVYRRGHGPNNKFNTFVTVLSLGTIHSIDATYMDKTAIAFGAGGNATGTFAGQIYQRSQLGACPEAAALSPPIDSPPGWTAAHKLSGLAAVMNTFAYDAKDKNGLTAIPQPSWIGKFVKVWDPRLDSTWPGGEGDCRAYDESSYVWSEDPHLHALTWALGRYQNGRQVAGIGLGNTVPAGVVRGIDVAAFVEGANLNDARGWKAGGTVYTRPDTPWNSLKAMLQAGGAAPVLIGGRISCVNRAPRVSLATIKGSDIVGECSFTGTQPRRSRINGIIPQYRSEAHDWEVVPGALVSIPAYVTLDGGERTREVAYPLVQQVDQASQLAIYDICDAREAGPGTVPLGPAWLEYRIGDCVTFEPEDGLSIKTLVIGRTPDPASGTIQFTLRGETDGKHALALGQTGTAPPIASLSYDRTVAPPALDDWELAGTALASNGTSIPALVIEGACSNASADAVQIEYRVHASGLGDEDGWIGSAIEGPTLTRKEITSVTPGTAYDVSVSYRVRGVIGARRIYGPVTAGALAVARGAHAFLAKTVTYPLTSTASTISIAAFDGVLDDSRELSLPSATITGLAADTSYVVLRDLVNNTYLAAEAPALSELANPQYAVIDGQATALSGGGYTPPDDPPDGRWPWNA